MKKWAVGLLAVLILFSGCVKQTLEIDAKLGAKRDGDSGYFAYYTARKSRPIESVKIFVASEDSLLKPRVSVENPKEKIYPIWVEESSRSFVPPEVLARLLGAELGPCDNSREYVEFGYFVNSVLFTTGFPVNHFDKTKQPFSKGMSWASPKKKMRDKIREAMEECRETAAEYGADAISEVVVYYGTTPTEGAQVYGVWLYAKAIVYVEE